MQFKLAAWSVLVHLLCALTRCEPAPYVGTLGPVALAFSLAIRHLLHPHTGDSTYSQWVTPPALQSCHRSGNESKICALWGNHKVDHHGYCLELQISSAETICFLEEEVNAPPPKKSEHHQAKWFYSCLHSQKGTLTRVYPTPRPLMHPVGTFHDHPAWLQITWPCTLSGAFFHGNWV